MDPDPGGPSVTTLWQRLESHLKNHAPDVLEFLNSAATEQEIRKAEAELGVSLPPDLAESLGVHNGQPHVTGYPPYPIPIVPSEYDAERGGYFTTSGELAALDAIVLTSKATARVDKWVPDDALASCEFQGPVRRDGNWAWIAFVDSGTGDILALDLNPAAGGHYGQVLAINHEGPDIFVLAPSYRSWFEELVKRYETGRYVIAQSEGEAGLFYASDQSGPRARG